MKPSSQTARSGASSPSKSNGHHLSKESMVPMEPLSKSVLDPEQQAHRARWMIALGLVVLAFAMRPFVGIRAVDPGYQYFVLEPVVGLVLFWPLSRVMMRAAGVFWGGCLSLLPTVILLLVRIYGSQRDIAFGNHPNLSYGTMVFLGICSMAAYILFGRGR